MNQPKDPKLLVMEDQAHIIEDPVKKEARAALQLEAMRRVLARLPKSVKRKLRQHENRGKGLADLMKSPGSSI